MITDNEWIMIIMRYDSDKLFKVISKQNIAEIRCQEHDKYLCIALLLLCISPRGALSIIKHGATM